jgi:predicted phage terminase large subunit-like protein
MTMLATPENVRFVDALVRRDFVSFITKTFHTLMPNASLLMNWHVYALAYHLELVRAGVIRRLIINLLPRSLKSITASVAFPAYVLGRDPTKRLLAISYNLDLARTHATPFRTIVNSPWYQRAFPLTRAERDTELEFVTAQNGFRRATSVDATLTGLGCDIALLDDPQSAIDAASPSGRQRTFDWYGANFPMLLDDKKTGAIVIVMQRLHIDDLVGRVLGSGEPWTVLRLPAIAERDERIPIGPNRYHERRAGDVLHAEREPLSELEPIRNLNPEQFAAQYQQAPFLPGGMIIKREWVHYYDALPVRDPSSLIVQSWDCASKGGDSNDWCACTTWLLQDRRYYLLDVLRERLDYPTLRARAIAHARTYRPDKIVIEDADIGRGLVQDLKTAGLPVVAVRPEGSKKTRMQIQSAKFQAGLVLLPRQAPWLADYQAELFAFPHAPFDDQVDSTSQLLAVEHSTYDPQVLAEGMARFCSGVTVEPFIRSLYYSKFGR